MVTSGDLWAIFCYMGIDNEARMILRVRRSYFNQMDDEQKIDAFREMPVWAYCASCPGSGIPDFRGKNGPTTERRAGLRDQSRGSDLQKHEKAYMDMAVKRQ